LHWFGVNVDEAALDHGEKTRKPIQAVGVYAVEISVGEQLRAAPGALRFESELQKAARESIHQFLIRNSKHRLASR
jgi:hypothetical protein